MSRRGRTKGRADRAGALAASIGGGVADAVVVRDWSPARAVIVVDKAPAVAVSHAIVVGERPAGQKQVSSPSGCSQSRG